MHERCKRTRFFGYCAKLTTRQELDDLDRPHEYRNLRTEPYAMHAWQLCPYNVAYTNTREHEHKRRL